MNYKVGDRVAFTFFGCHTGTIIRINPDSVTMVDDCSGSVVSINQKDYKLVKKVSTYEEISRNSCVIKIKNTY